MRIVAVCGLKGGVGKTSITLGLASAAAERDLPTVVVDLDPQADATMALATEPGAGRSALDVVRDPAAQSVADALQTSAWSRSLLVLPSPAPAPDDEGGTPPPPDNLRRALHNLPAGIELVLIDCPPTASGLTRSALMAADRAIVVTEPGLFAVAATNRALRLIHHIKSHGLGQVQPLGIVVNRVREGHREHLYRLTELRSLFGPLLLSPVLPERAAIQQAEGALRPIHSWPGNAAAELSAGFDLLLDRIMRAPSTR